MRTKPLQPILFGLLLLFAAGCAGQGEQPIFQGQLRFLEVKTEGGREGGGDFSFPVHGKVYRDYLVVTYSPGTGEEHTDVFPANRLWKVEFGTKMRSGGKTPAPEPAKK
jgi:hypothetical protein